MRNLLDLLIIGVLVFWLVRFVLGLIRGRVKGAHPVEKKLTWIDRAEHPRLFWVFTFLQCLLFFVITLIVVGLRNNPVY